MISIENGNIPWYPKVFFQKVWCLTSSKHFCNRSYHSSINFYVYTANTSIWKLKNAFFDISRKNQPKFCWSWFERFGELWVLNEVFIAHLSNGNLTSGQFKSGGGTPSPIDNQDYQIFTNGGRRSHQSPHSAPKKGITKTWRWILPPGKFWIVWKSTFQFHLFSSFYEIFG